MKKSVQHMNLILEEIRTIKNEVCAQAPIKESWIDGIEVQSTLHISESTLYRHRKSGRLAYSRIRGKIYYKPTDIRNLLEKNYRIPVCAGASTGRKKPKCTCCCKK